MFFFGKQREHMNFFAQLTGQLCLESSGPSPEQEFVFMCRSPLRLTASALEHWTTTVMMSMLSIPRLHPCTVLKVFDQYVLVQCKGLEGFLALWCPKQFVRSSYESFINVVVHALGS